MREPRGQYHHYRQASCQHFRLVPRPSIGQNFTWSAKSVSAGRMDIAPFPAGPGV